MSLVPGAIRAGAVVLALVALIGCEPTTPPPGVGTGSPAASGEPAGPPAGTSIITVNGDTTEIIGTGNNTTDDFDLAAGSAEMTVSACSSNQVIPFVTIYDGKDNKLALIVDAEYTLKNVAGGAYYLQVAANPTCTWTITLKAG